MTLSTEVDTTFAGEILVAGNWVQTTATAPIADPDDDSVFASVGLASSEDADAALEAAANAATARAWSTSDRFDVLMRASAALEERAEQAARTIAREGIKTISEAQREVSRAIRTLQLSAAAAVGPRPGIAPSDDRTAAQGWTSRLLTGPVGPVLAITPYNDPLNLVAHKVGPALASGSPIIVKPDMRTPLSALLLADCLQEAGVPAGYLSVLPTRREITTRMLTDNRVRFVSFTGGREAGGRIHAASGPKRMLLEMGGVCPTIVFPDWDVQQAAIDITEGSIAAAGQNCLHVQRVLVHRSVYSALRDALEANFASIRMGSKSDPLTEMGPQIDVTARERIADVLARELDLGARILVGGKFTGTSLTPTLVADLSPESSLRTEEVFAPITTIEPFESVDEAVAMANACFGGIHAGVLTHDASVASELIQRLDFGGVVIGGTSDIRADSQPFGGSGSAGLGREGVFDATSAMLEPKAVYQIPRRTP